MDNNKKNEELQSRREFFKSAAKAALPVIGAFVLSQMPTVEAEADCGCNNRCMNTCWNGCYQSCKARCQNECHYNSK